MSARSVSRRSAAAGGVAMLLVAAAAAGQAKAEELDHEIMALAAEFHATERELDDLSAEDEALPHDDPHRVEIRGRESVLVDRRLEIREEMARRPTRTPEGMRAKATVVCADFVWAADERAVLSYEPQAALVVSLARDILGRAA